MVNQVELFKWYKYIHDNRYDLLFKISEDNKFGAGSNKWGSGVEFYDDNFRLDFEANINANSKYYDEISDIDMVLKLSRGLISHIFTTEYKLGKI